MTPTPNTADDATLCVIYAAKSTQDTRGSIPTQLEDCRGKATDEGWTVIAEYKDEGFSAYSGNRGPGLADARETADQAAAEVGRPVMLLAQHSDRFSRGGGDRPRAAEALIEIWHHERRRNVHLRSVEDDFDLRDSASVANIGERNRADSARKSKSVTKGKHRRFERGDAMGGPINDGYRLASVPGEDGEVVKRRELDPVRSPIVGRIFDLIERGVTFGEAARIYNDEGIRTRTGKLWRTRTVREIVTNPFYAGMISRHGEQRPGNHPPLIEPLRWQAIQEGLARLDPAAMQRRKGGRRPTQEHLLRGLAFCWYCGDALYTVPRASGRHYICRNVREATGTCSAPLIPAVELEGQTLNHIHDFFKDFNSWATKQLATRQGERAALEAALDREHERMATLDRDRERVLADYRRLAGKPTADIALEAAERIDCERAAQAERIANMQARIAEWTTAPSTNAMLDFYRELRGVMVGRLATSQSTVELRGALHSLLEGVWARVEPNGRVLYGEYVLRDSLDVNLGEIEREVPIRTWLLAERDRPQTEQDTFV